MLQIVHLQRTLMMLGSRVIVLIFEYINVENSRYKRSSNV